MHDLHSPTINHRHIAYPPGGILIWIIIGLELGTFGMGTAAVIYYGRIEPDVFAAASASLDRYLGAVNTAVLLTSGFLMARAVEEMKTGAYQRTVQLLLLTIFGGFLFSVLKGYEYTEKLNAGITISGNMFETLYWLLTGFHLVHIWVGMVILAYMAWRIRKSESPAKVLDLETAGAFWHMCDLIWLFLFPTLYLIF